MFEKTMKPRSLLTIVLVLGLSFSAIGQQVPPDLTRGEIEGGGVKVERTRTYNLGPTGLRGWIYTKPAAYLDSVQGRTTAASRQILVTHVGAASPADGVMAVDDVILGVGREPFGDDARKQFGRAITEAEKPENKGVLNLIRFRDGQTEQVALQLRVMGAYSDKAPYRCKKSDRILDDVCDALASEPLHLNQWGAVNGLALLATGRSAYLPKVQTFARAMADRESKRDGGGAWDCGYMSLFLAEYYLLTGDDAVFPGIKALVVKIARGQGMYGTYGHGFSELTADGALHGSIPPYGPVNQAGLIASLGLVVGAKCGIDDAEIAPAIERASMFYNTFVDKGAVPYGEHIAWPYHENNGKNALAALMYAIQGTNPKAAHYYAKMAAAAYANREYGHTGQGFGYLWSALGANAGGPAAAAAFFKEAAWHLDLVRRSDGTFTYDGGEQYGPGKTHDDTYYGKSSYAGLSPNATYVLTYAMPLKTLYITGKKANRSGWLRRKDVAEAIASGRFDVERKQMAARELVAAFSDWSPVVRGWAAEELALRPEAPELVPALITLAEGPDARARQGACEALGYIKRVEALPVFVRLLKHDDRWLRVKAAEALGRMGDAARPVVPDMLKALIETAEPLYPISWRDPIQLAQGALAKVLFKGGALNATTMKSDQALLYPAIRAVSRNADGMTRALLRNTFQNQLSVEDVQALAPDILAAVRVRAPADTMFGNEIRMGGFKALTKYNFIEGVEAGLIVAKTQGGHGSEKRTGEIMRAITPYGSAAREGIPAMRALIDQFMSEVENRRFPRGELNQRRVNAVKDAIVSIEAATTHPELRRIVK